MDAPNPVIRSSGLPAPTSRYPTVPAAVWAMRVGAVRTFAGTRVTGTRVTGTRVAGARVARAFEGTVPVVPQAAKVTARPAAANACFIGEALNMALLPRGRAETDEVPVRIGVRTLAELVGRRADGPGVAANVRPAPLFVEGIGVAHVQVRRCMVRRIVVGVRRQVQSDAFAVGEAVVVAVGVGEGVEAEGRVVGQGSGQIPHREDRAEVTELAGWPLPPGSGDHAGRFDLGQGGQHGSHGLDLLRRYPLLELDIDRLDAAHYGVEDLLPAFGELEGDSAAVVGIGTPGEIAPVHQSVDHLAHGLFGDTEIGRQVPSGAARGVDPGQDECSVSGQVVEADGVQLRPDGAGVSAARRAHQGGSGELPGSWSVHGR